MPRALCPYVSLGGRTQEQLPEVSSGSIHWTFLQGRSRLITAILLPGYLTLISLGLLSLL